MHKNLSWMFPGDSDASQRLIRLISTSCIFIRCALCAPYVGLCPVTSSSRYSNILKVLGITEIALCHAARVLYAEPQPKPLKGRPERQNSPMVHRILRR